MIDMKQERALALKIINASARAFGVKPRELYRNSKLQDVADAKACASFILKSRIQVRPSVLARITGLDRSMLRNGQSRMEDALELNDSHSGYLRQKLRHVISEVYKIEERPVLNAGDLNHLAGCNIAGRIQVAQSLIDDKEYQRAHEELEDLLKFVNAPQYHTAKVVIEIKNGIGNVVEQPDYIYVEFK